MSIERVDEYILLAKRKQELEAELREVKGKLEKTETRLTDYFAEKGLKNVRTENGMAYLSREIFAGLAPEENGGHEEAHAALRQHGLGYMVKDGVNANTLRAYVREREEAGEEIPRDLLPHIKITEVFRVRVRS